MRRLRAPRGGREAGAGAQGGRVPAAQAQARGGGGAAPDHLFATGAAKVAQGLPAPAAPVRDARHHQGRPQPHVRRADVLQPADADQQQRRAAAAARDECHL